MAEAVVNFTAEERDFLAELLKLVLKDVQIEEHRTRALSYREHIVQKGEMINALLKKLGKASG
ncbi:MAG: hypothetical protein FJ303_19275 [Planctomycetes bacterium]|nr:hypothetical protein [Planctomycetota bacterium]